MKFITIQQEILTLPQFNSRSVTHSKNEVI